MDRKTNLRDMDAPGVNSGKYAGDTILAVKSAESTPAEKATNVLKEHTTGPQPKSNLGGKNAFK